MEKENKHISSQVMELKDLISGPLVATIDADTISARRYLSYLYELAFESYDKKTGKAGPLRMLEFTYQTNGTEGIYTQKVKIPMLTLVPLPLLQVKEADFDFDIHIVDALKADKNATFSLNNPKEDTIGQKETNDAEGLKLRVTMAPQLEGSVSTKTNNSLTANMKVSVKMRQADLPDGLTKLLNLASNNALSTERNSEENK